MADTDIRKLWMPLQKQSDGTTLAILSDTSIDRDEEAMDKDLILNWAKNKTLPMLANHENKMEKLLGVWKNMRPIQKGGSAALMAEPDFLESSPFAQQVKAMVEEALAKGAHVGVSIGAIPTAWERREVKGKEILVWTEAELLEATFVPVQSNRNASFGHIAKKFGIGEEDVQANKERKGADDPSDTPHDHHQLQHKSAGDSDGCEEIGGEKMAEEDMAKDAPATEEKEVEEKSEDLVEEKMCEEEDDKKEDKKEAPAEETKESPEAEEKELEEEAVEEKEVDTTELEKRIKELEEENEALKKEAVDLPSAEAGHETKSKEPEEKVPVNVKTMAAGMIK